MDAFWIIFLAALGACVGSFLNVVIYRVPRGKSIVFPASHCPSCGRAIKPYDNIPIVSWILLRGRCRMCGVRISPRYLFIEALTAALVVGLYVAYFMADLRVGATSLMQDWPMFIAHGTLVCALLACSVVDLERWEVLPEACWFAAAVGMAAATYQPHPFLPRVPATWGAMAVGGAAGVAISVVLQWRGILQPSFLDADDKPVPETGEGSETLEEDSPDELAAPADSPDSPHPAAGLQPGGPGERRNSVGFTAASGTDPRREMFRELLYLAPAMLLAAAAWMLVTYVPAVGAWWDGLTSGPQGSAGYHVRGFLASLAGFLIGGGWIWGVRILGTLAFGREAMGLGDVHILAAVGAVTGCLVPTLAFFLAPFFGLLWAVYLVATRNQRELPYGPWLAVASVVVMVFHDSFLRALVAYVNLL